MVDITQIKTRAGEAIKLAQGRSLASAARDNGFRSISALMEDMDPSDPGESRIGFDAFNRGLAYLGVRTRTDPYGSYVSSRSDELFKEDRRELFSEFCRRSWVEGTTEGVRARAEQQRESTYQELRNALNEGRPGGERAAAEYLSTDFAVGTINRPYDDDRTLRRTQIEPAIPLSAIISRTRINQGQDYRSRYLTTPVPGDVRLLRVAEIAELPTATITESSRTIRLFKFGRKLRASYEVLRRTQLDDLREHIAQLAIQTEVDQVAAAIDVMINGDGNAGTSATVYNLTALDPATTANNLTLTAWLSFRLKWANPYAPSAVIARAAEMLKVLTLTVGNANTLTASASLASIQQELRPMNNRLADGLLYGITDDAPVGRIIGMDGRFAVERAVEAGSEIAETERFITRQAEEMTFSMNEGYASIDPNAVKILNLTA